MDHLSNENKGLTLVGFLVAVCVIFFLLFILFLLSPPLKKVKPIAKRVVCGAYLRGLGTAMTVYANDYEGHFPQLPGEGPWSKELGFEYDLQKPDFDGQQSNTGRTITASWYLLVKEADVSPKSFVCPSSKEEEFDGENPGNLDVVKLWDFGDHPYRHVSYVMHNPYGRYPGHEKRGQQFAVAADMNPWINTGDFVTAPNEYNHPQIIQVRDTTTYTFGNSLDHPEANPNGWAWNKYLKGTAEGQNVLFADGHVEFTKQPNCGVNDDNIYTYWSTDENPSMQDIQGGTAPTARDEENDAKSQEDSLLVL